MSGLKRMRATVLATAVALPLTVGGSAAAAYGRYDKLMPAAASTGTPSMVRGVVAAARKDVSALRSSLGLPVVPLGQHPELWWLRTSYCDPHTGPYQTQIERLLHLLVYGGQTHTSCVAIRHYQRTHGIHPAIGYAGPSTWHRLHERYVRYVHRHWRTRPAHHFRTQRHQRHQRHQRNQRHLGHQQNQWHQQHQRHQWHQGHHRYKAHTRSIKRLTRNPNVAGHCPVGNFRIACVDQNRQIMWVQQGRRIVFGPVRVRTGYGRYRTRNGMDRIYWKHRRHVSTLYDLPMPYAQFFDRGEAFHGIYGSLTSRHRSFGCVNLRLADARRLWNVLRVGDRVYRWGYMPGHRYA